MRRERKLLRANRMVAWSLGAPVLLFALFPVFRWAIVDATFLGSDSSVCIIEGVRKPGACWPAAIHNVPVLLSGRFPQEYAWRPLLLLALGVGSLALPILLRLRTAFWLLIPAAVFPLQLVLLSGAPKLGLAAVPTELWGGLALTWLLSAGAILISIVPGLALALARTGSVPLWRALATGFIEVIRGVPLITLLFVGHFLFPLFLPRGGLRIDELARAVLMLAAFLSAYSAEVWRGGLLAVPRGQGEAAHALSLSNASALRHVVLPQAARTALPGLVFTFIGLFKDTSLVNIIGLYDLLGMARAVPRSPEWLGFDLEPLVFAGILYVAIGMGITAAGRTLETRWSYPT